MTEQVLSAGRTYRLSHKNRYQRYITDFCFTNNPIHVMKVTWIFDDVTNKRHLYKMIFLFLAVGPQFVKFVD